VPATPSIQPQLAMYRRHRRQSLLRLSVVGALPGQQDPGGHQHAGPLHAGAVINGILTAQAHYIGSFVQDKRWNVASTGGTSTYPGYGTAPGYGYIRSLALDFKLDGGWMGDGYIGYSYIKAKNGPDHQRFDRGPPLAGRLAVHAELFPHGKYPKHGRVATARFTPSRAQYTFSLAAFMMRPRPFWGQAADFTIRPFFMYNKVAGTLHGVDNMTKLKAAWTSSTRSCR
jgi:hypothetical protein